MGAQQAMEQDWQNKSESIASWYAGQHALRNAYPGLPPINKQCVPDPTIKASKGDNTKAPSGKWQHDDKDNAQDLRDKRPRKQTDRFGYSKMGGTN